MANKIFCIMGKSGSGKDTIFERLKNDDEVSLNILVGYSTRPIRSGEKNGREYFFVNQEELSKMESEGIVIERRDYNTVHGIWSYFTADDGQVDFDKGSYLYIVTLEGYIKLKEYYGKDKVVPIYISVENGERLERALQRERKQKEPRYAEMCRRFLADEKDFSDKKLADAGIEKVYENDDLNECIKEIKKDILNRE